MTTKMGLSASDNSKLGAEKFSQHSTIIVISDAASEMNAHLKGLKRRVKRRFANAQQLYSLRGALCDAATIASNRQIGEHFRSRCPINPDKSGESSFSSGVCRGPNRISNFSPLY